MNKPEDCYYWGTKRKPQSAEDRFYFDLTKWLGRTTAFDIDDIQRSINIDWDSKTAAILLDKTSRNRLFMKNSVNQFQEWDGYKLSWSWKKN